MVIITDNGTSVKVDMTAFIQLSQINNSIIYIMKDKTVYVNVERNGKWVEIVTSLGSHQLDMNGENGLPAKVGNKIPSNNFELASELAALKNL